MRMVAWLPRHPRLAWPSEVRAPGDARLYGDDTGERYSQSIINRKRSMRMGLFKAGEGTITRGVDEIESDCKTDCCQGTSGSATKFVSRPNCLIPFIF